MLNSRQLRSWSTAMAAVPTIFLALSTVASGNPVQSVGARQERNPVPMLYPGEMAICPACCSGPCMCIPNARYWGHFPRQWSPWPGDEHRADVRFPADRGIERIPSPQGELPKELPKEEYAPPETEPGPGVRIQEGPPSGPIPTTPLPFQEFGLPGLDFPPQGGAPETPPTETTPRTEQPPIPNLPGMDSTYVIPPAPMPHQTKWVPTGSSLAPAPLPTILPPGKVLPTTLVGQPGTATPVENLGFEPNEAPMPPISVVNVGGEPMPLPDLTSNQCVELTARPDPLDGSVPLAPLPGTPAPTASEPSPMKDPPQPAKPWVEAGEWKSRRPASEPSKALTVEFQKPVDVHPVGLDGYCPVELARHEQWVDGNPQLAVEHEGRTYLLSGPQQQRLFRANPERYAPVLAGRDPVLAATSGDLVPGRTEMCVIYDGRLFMFSSKATLAAFNEDPERFAGELAQPAK